jgi:guanylate kinase
MTIVFIISAPSGSGKSTLVEKVRPLIADLDFSVSYTTRKPRGPEKDRREYCFVPLSEFEVMIRRDEFLEYAKVFGNRGNYYGTAKRVLEEAERASRDLLLDIDVNGAEQVKQKIPDAVRIFILPPNRRELEKRLRLRSQDAEEVIQYRLDTATREIEKYSEYDYILVNDDLKESVEALKAILLAERLQRKPASHLSEEEKEILAKAESRRLKNVRERVQPILASFAAAAVSRGS